MRILLVSQVGDGAWFVHTLKREGHQVDWTIEVPEEANLIGLVPRPRKSANPANYDLVVFDRSGMGQAADAALAVTPTIGGSTFCDRLEEDRLFGLEVMEQCGIAVPNYEVFSDASAAISWLREHNVRTVFKPIGEVEDKALTYVSSGAEDMTRFIEKHKSKVKSFVLQEFVAGTEISTEAWFNGTDWFAINHTLEEKKFMNDGLGPNTGCAGNVIWMPASATRLFTEGLDKVKPILADAGFVGVIDLNCIVTESKAYGLEWTPRFGYHGVCNLTRLLNMPFGEFMHRIATGQSAEVSSRSRFAATVTISVPPYPAAERHGKKNLVTIGGFDPERLHTFYLCDADLNDDGELITGKGKEYPGLIGTPIGCSETISGAFDECYTAIKRLEVPDVQYRTDLSKVVEKRFNTLERQGWLRS